MRDCLGGPWKELVCQDSGSDSHSPPNPHWSIRGLGKQIVEQLAAHHLPQGRPLPHHTIPQSSFAKLLTQGASHVSQSGALL